MNVFLDDGDVRVLHGDCIAVMRELPAESVDAVICDPPYGLEFMGKDWDSFRSDDPGTNRHRGERAGSQGELAERDGATLGGRLRVGYGGTGRAKTNRCKGCGKRDQFRNPHESCGDGVWVAELIDPHAAPPTMLAFQNWCREWATEAYRVLKPGGHLAAFGGTRTSHRLAAGIEDAGFEIRDTLAYMFGSGFPKAWSFKTQYPADAWCECGNAIPYAHDETPEHDLRPLRSTDLPAPLDAHDQHREVLFASLPEPGAPEPRQARPEPEASGRAQSSMEGRQLHRASEGLPHDPPSAAPTGESERVRVGAPADSRNDAGTTARAGRGSAPHQRAAVGQPAGEPEGVCNAQRALADGALRDGGRCARCGQLAEVFRGFASALKPGYEPITLARKPLSGTLAQTTLKHGTGALNIDACRIEHDGSGIWGNHGQNPENHVTEPGSEGTTMGTGWNRPGSERNPAGRWPANVILDAEAAAILDQQTGDRASGSSINGRPTRFMAGSPEIGERNFESYDRGGASRFFYTAKASGSERNDGLHDLPLGIINTDTPPGSKGSNSPRAGAGRGGPTANTHPTVKPVDLMRWLIRLLAPPGALILDPFAGSGTTGVAARAEHVRCVLIEREVEYLPIIAGRLSQQALF